jgi:hypothetical protein
LAVVPAAARSERAAPADGGTRDRTLRVVELLDEILAEIHQAERLRWVRVAKHAAAVRQLVVELGRPARRLPHLSRVYQALAAEAQELEAAAKIEDREGEKRHAREIRALIVRIRTLL